MHRRSVVFPYLRGKVVSGSAPSHCLHGRLRHYLRRPHQFHLMASASSQSARRGSCQSSRDATSQSSKVGRRKWTIFKVEKLVEAMREMVEVGVYKADNGFKPEYLHFLEEKMRASCPSFGFKAIPHIESRVKNLKKDWTTVHDILTGVRHGCGSFGYDNRTNTIVASDDVWNFPERDAHSAVDYLDPANEDIADLSDSESGGPNTMNVADSSSTMHVHSKTPETSSKGWKRLSNNSRTTIGDYMLQAAEVMAIEIGKSTIKIAKAILDYKDMREAVVASLEEVYGILPIERAIYATKLAKGNELMVGFLSLDLTYRLAWMQRMFPDVM
ncbi:hypothetical protein Sjap_017805 [Stephania japonica]|uniref:Myb/SANT-like domain-containing protein n=1 Tax=Stephania japonica TaxID=461633 RepID=A0AAP0I6V6_9MAGN